MLDKSFQRIDIFKRTMDASWLKNEAISNNLANINTPGYKRQVVNFEGILKNHLNMGDQTQMRVTNQVHLTANGAQGLRPQIQEVSDTSYRTDGNNVNVDVEMAELAKNQLKYAALTEQLNGQLTRLKLAIKGG